MKNNPLWLFVFLCCLFVSCKPNYTPDVVVKEVPAAWNKTKPVDVFYENSDTLSLKEIYMLIRFRNDFPYDRFDFALETLTPDSLLWKDTLSVYYTPEKNDPETISLTYTDIKAVYRSQSRLNGNGTYRFRFNPLMPQQETTGIIGVGIEITKN